MAGIGDIVGPVTLDHEGQREKFERDGVTYVHRHDERTTGETWWRAETNGTKQGEAKITYVDPVSAFDSLRPLLPDTGFTSIPEWMRVAAERESAAADSFHDGHIYLVMER